jgi:hypothetical protein
MIDLPDYGPGEAEQREMLRSLLEVGPSKPVGYLPLSAIRAAKSVPEIITISALADGLAAIEFPPGACCIESGALYVYDRVALDALLQRHAGDAAAAGLPLQADAFVARIAAFWFDRNHRAHPIIAAAFGEATE